MLIEYFFGMPRFLSSYPLSTDTFTVQMISKILVPHDGTEMSDKAFKKAVELAKMFKVPFKKINKKSNAAKVLLLYYQYRTMRIINYTRRHTSQ